MCPDTTEEEVNATLKGEISLLSLRDVRVLFPWDEQKYGHGLRLGGAILGEAESPDANHTCSVPGYKYCT